jgi:hypothetical protein
MSMTIHATNTAPAPDRTASPVRPPALLVALRLAATVNAAVVLGQAVLAGMILDGSDSAADAHRTNGQVFLAVTLVQLVLAVLLWRPARGPGWPALASGVLLTAAATQYSAGEDRNLALHIPLGVTVFGIVVSVMVGLWRSRARTGGRR